MGQRVTIKTEGFEGPIQLLLSMVQERKLAINDVSLAQVADDFLAQIQELGQQISNHERTNFLVVAATLVLIKSRTLLPTLEISVQEEESIDQLQHRLRLYQAVQEIGGVLGAQYGTQRMYGRPRIPQKPIFSPDRTVQIGDWQHFVAEIVGRIPKPEVAVKRRLKRVVVHIEDIMQRIDRELSSGQINLGNLVRTMAKKHGNEKGYDRVVKTYAVVGFLATLEMVKNGLAQVAEQADQFADIEIKPTVPQVTQL